MQQVIDDFRARMKEVWAYLEVLKVLEDPQLRLVSPTSSSPAKPDGEWLKVLKAACYLLLYNTVEATVRGAFRSVYERIGTDRLDCHGVSELVRDVWLEQQYSVINEFSASGRNYLEHSKDIVKRALMKIELELDADLLPISGNLDADKICTLCSRHGVSIRTSRAANGGHCLRAIKEQRNALAHGDVSFSECGRSITVSTLEQITRQTEIYLGSIVDNVKTFAQSRGYAA